MWAMNSVIGNTILAESATFQAIGTGDSIPASPSTSEGSTGTATKNHHGKPKHSHSIYLSGSDLSGSVFDLESAQSAGLSTLPVGIEDESIALSGSVVGDLVTGERTTGSTPTTKSMESVADLTVKHNKTISANDDDSLSGGNTPILEHSDDQLTHSLVIDGLSANAALSDSLSGSAIPSSSKSGANTIKFNAISAVLTSAMGFASALILF